MLVRLSWLALILLATQDGDGVIYIYEVMETLDSILDPHFHRLKQQVVEQARLNRLLCDITFDLVCLCLVAWLFSCLFVAGAQVPRKGPAAASQTANNIAALCAGQVLQRPLWPRACDRNAG